MKEEKNEPRKKVVVGWLKGRMDLLNLFFLNFHISTINQLFLISF
jgi:hypothetical protein